MTPEERAALHRMLAAQYRMDAITQDMLAAMETVGASFQRLADGLRAAEVSDVQNHPDLAELDAQLDGYYGQDTAR